MSERITWFTLAVLLMAMCIFLCVWAENGMWNDGICDICGEGYWEFVQAVGHRNSTNYLYKCDHCGYIVELEWYHQEIGD